MTPQEFISLLSQIPIKTRNMNHSPAIASVVPIVFASVENNYSRQVDSNGAVWPPRKDNLPHPLLILSTAMLDASTGGIGSLVRYTRDGVEMGVRSDIVPYAEIHQYGSSRIPQRQYFYLNAQDKPDVVRQFKIKTSEEFRKQVLGG